MPHAPHHPMCGDCAKECRRCADLCRDMEGAKADTPDTWRRQAFQT